MTKRQKKEVPENEVNTEAAAFEDVEALKQQLAEETARAEDYLANWQRAQADFINYKRRMEQERNELNQFANSNLILSILPVIDDLERALDSIPAEYAELDWVEGIRLIERKLKSTLETQGVKPIKAVGEPFDPNFHEAIRQDKGTDGIVIDEFQKGYLLHDRLLRPTKVVVGNGETEEEKEEQRWRK